MATYPLLIGLRYSFSAKRNRFTAVIATISLLGMVIGVASLITVLSIMNGFGSELRGRILSLVPHGFVTAENGRMGDWQTVARDLARDPEVLAVAPFITEKVIISARGSLRGARLTAIDSELEAGVSAVEQAVSSGSFDDLEQRPFTIVLGAALARSLRVAVGDRVELTLPRLTVTPLGAFPRTKQVQVVGLFEVGAQPDAYQAYVSLATGQRLLGMGVTVQGLQLRTRDLFEAPAIMSRLGDALPPGFEASNWSQTQGSLFQAVRMEKLMVSLLLLSVVAVAAFNIVSTLAMSVTEKRGDIAVLRTMGASAWGVMSVFMVHGLSLAVAGISLGLLLGVLLAKNVAALTVWIENLVGARVFDPSVYFITELPSVLLWSDVLAVCLAALALSFLATLYPAWRGARVAPAEVLRYE